MLLAIGATYVTVQPVRQQVLMTGVWCRSGLTRSVTREAAEVNPTAPIAGRGLRRRGRAQGLPRVRHAASRGLLRGTGGVHHFWMRRRAIDGSERSPSPN